MTHEERAGVARSLTPLQREVEPPPVCTRCGRPISVLSDLYRCAQCHAAFDLGCIHEHFGWSVNEHPHEPNVIELARETALPAERDALREALTDAGWMIVGIGIPPGARAVWEPDRTNLLIRIGKLLPTGTFLSTHAHAARALLRPSEPVE